MFRSGCWLMTRRISSGVPSVECPSTKMISWRVPNRGIRRMAGSMLPRSFRQGMTMVVEYSWSPRGSSGRATT